MARNVASYGLNRYRDLRERRSKYLGEGPRYRLLIIYRIEMPVRGIVIMRDRLEL